VSPEQALSRLYEWQRQRDNIDKTFITFDEVEEAVCRIDANRRLRQLDPRQVRNFFTVCGQIHIYTIEQAKLLERDWEQSVDVAVPWERKDAFSIALECHRLAEKVKVVDGQSTEAQRAETERALNEYDVSVASMRTQLTPLVKNVIKAASESVQRINV